MLLKKPTGSVCCDIRLDIKNHKCPIQEKLIVLESYKINQIFIAIPAPLRINIDLVIRGFLNFSVLFFNKVKQQKFAAVLFVLL